MQILNGQGLGLPHNFQDYLMVEMARIHTGNESYSGFIRNLAFFNPEAFKYLLDESQFVPSVQDFSEFFHLIKLDSIYTIFYETLSEYLDLRLFSFQILIWDCHFIHTNGSDYKHPYTGKYSDRDAGIGSHQNKYLGLGYMASILYAYCGELVVPVFCMIFPANLSDKDIFYDTITGYCMKGLPLPYLILADGGAYSIKNLRFLTQKGIIGMINAPKIVKYQNITILQDDIRINRDFVPSAWSEAELLELYYLRTSIER